MGVFIPFVPNMSTDADPVQTTTSENTQNVEKQVPAEILERRVFAGNLSFRTNVKSLKEAFSQVGTVEKVNVVSKNRRRLGFGFVQFSSKEEAEKAIVEMNGKEVDGREIKVESSKSTTVPNRKKGKKPKAATTAAKKEQPKKNNTSESNEKPVAKKAPAKKKAKRVPLDQRKESDDVLYVKGISESTEQSAVEEMFKDFGVTSVSIRSSYRGKGKPKSRFAFVTVNSAENQQAAVDKLNETEVDGQTITVKKAFTAIPPVQEEEATEKPKRKQKPRKKKPNKKKPVKKEGEEKEEAEAETVPPPVVEESKE